MSVIFQTTYIVQMAKLKNVTPGLLLVYQLLLCRWLLLPLGLQNVVALMSCNYIVNVCLIVNVATLGGGVCRTVHCRMV